MNENDKLVTLLADYKTSLVAKTRDEVFKMSSTVESIILRYFPAESAYLKDMKYVRQNLGYMVAFKTDNGNMGQDLPTVKKFFSGILDSLCDEISTIGVPNKETPKDSLVSVNVTQNQSQEQKQVVTFFIDSIKDEISGKQLKELQEIAKSEPDPEKAKPKIIDHIKSFGVDVCSNILANIMTNPAIWTGLF
jgi:hypothetical protein